MGIVCIEKLTHAIGSKQLYVDATIKVNRGEHIALIGLNGVGKSTLLKIIYGTLFADESLRKINRRSKIGFLDQHLEVDGNIIVSEYFKESYKHLFDKEKEMHDLYDQMAIDYKEEILVKAMNIQEELNINDFDLIGQKIGRLVDGLGIEKVLLEKPFSKLSGGQKGKVLLAKLLLNEDDFLLLDEPTNFLDIEQINWLAKFLRMYKSAFLMVSHDRDFINQTCNIIYAIENKAINRYVGDFEDYLGKSQLKRDQYERDYKSQQKTIKKLKTYVAKNAARASTAKSAQSRQKQLNKMDVIDQQKNVGNPKFSFKYKKISANVLFEAKDLSIGYDKPLIKPLTFVFKQNEKWIVKGQNGIGKTTFLNTISKHIDSLGGEITLATGAVISYFKQTESIDDITPIQYLQDQFPGMPEGEIRALVSNFGVKSALMMNPMSKLSGGEQTKVRLAALSLFPSNILILDEPTNHIDVLAKESLIKAIQDFPGTVLLTTHDINFNTSWAEHVLDFEDLIK